MNFAGQMKRPPLLLPVNRLNRPRSFCPGFEEEDENEEEDDSDGSWVAFLCFRTRIGTMNPVTLLVLAVVLLIVLDPFAPISRRRRIQSVHGKEIAEQGQARCLSYGEGRTWTVSPEAAAPLR